METETGAEYISEAHVRHIMRYVQARDWLHGEERIVFDAACGTGYGSKILAKNFMVIGLDFDDAALAEARKLETAGLKFIKADLLQPSFRKGNAVVSLETIEHFSAGDGQIILDNFHKNLNSDGILIISTPYCLQSGPSPITRQHLWEYSLTDFENLISTSGFAIEQIKVDRHEGQAGRLGYCMVKARKR